MVSSPVATAALIRVSAKTSTGSILCDLGLLRTRDRGRIVIRGISMCRGRRDTMELGFIPTGFLLSAKVPDRISDKIGQLPPFFRREISVNVSEINTVTHAGIGSSCAVGPSGKPSTSSTFYVAKFTTTRRARMWSMPHVPDN